jgi:hypothetical protein
MLNCNKNLHCKVDTYFVSFRSVFGFCDLAGEACKECIVGTVRDAHTTPRHELDDRAIPFSVLVVTHHHQPDDGRDFFFVLTVHARGGKTPRSEGRVTGSVTRWAAAASLQG